MRRPNPLLAFLAMLAFVVSGQPSSFELPGFELPASPQERKMKWPARPIQIALSTSLFLPSSALKPESDVAGAVRRALNSWSTVADVTFVEVASKAQSISPTNSGDGINLITIAPTAENLAVFGEGNNTARTRVFYNPDTGEIDEVDIAINPFPYAEDGALLQFSTDGAPGTYDLESTLAHELGHLLGLSHSNVIASTMQASQGLNGTYGLPALSERTLGETDLVAVRSLYGSPEKLGSIEGRILNSNGGNLLPALGAHVWIEDLPTGRVMASSQTTSSGKFSLNGIPPGSYRAMAEYRDESVDASSGEREPRSRRRVFRSIEIKSRLRITADKTTTLNYVLVPPQNSPPGLNPRFIGTNGELSTLPVPTKPRSKFTLYVGGEGVDQVPGSGLLISSPFITVDPASLTLEHFNSSTPVISFEVTVAADAPAGDYSVRLQSNSGEIAYLVGGITINPGF